MRIDLTEDLGQAEQMTELALSFLHSFEIAMIDEALAAVGDFGEVHLIVENRRLRFVVTQRSADALKWQPGSLPDPERLSRGPAARGAYRGQP